MSEGGRLLDRLQELSSTVLHAIDDRLAAEVGVSPRASVVVMLMWAEGAPRAVTFRQIEEALGLSQSAASRLTTGLEKDGHVEFRSDVRDARAKVVELTKSGVAIAKRVAAIRGEVADEQLSLDKILGLVRGQDGGLPGALAGLISSGEPNVLRFGESYLRVAAEPVEIADVLYVRDALEPVMLLEATRFRTEVDVAECRGLIGLMQESVTDPARFYRADWALHRRIADVCRNKVLQRTYVSLLETLEDRLDEVVPAEGLGSYLDRRLVIHGEIVEAMASGDEGRMRRAATAHEFLGLDDRAASEASAAASAENWGQR